MNKPDWQEETTVAITVTDASGTILQMNEYSRQVFKKYGGNRLIGKSVFDCHPGESREKIRKLYRDQRPNHYTITKEGQKKIIHQIPWYHEGVFAGFVEISLPIPDPLPHFNR